MKAAEQKQLTPYFEFGPFMADPVKCVLIRDGNIVPLSLKAFEIMLLLIQNRSQVVEKDEILKRIWPDTVVEENNLARNISILRKALDEQPNQHQYILTIPGRGYRFVASVREINSLSESKDSAESSQPAVEQSVASPEISPRPNQLRIAETPVPDAPVAPSRTPSYLQPWTWVLAGGILALPLLFYLGNQFWKKPSDSSPPTQRKLWQLTFDPGLESEPSWSPDGRMIAYASDRSGNFDIWVQPVGEGNPVRVTSSPAHDWQPDWAPEGNRLAYRSERDGGGLYIVPILGGNERKVSSFGYRPRWSRDGSQILFSSTLIPVSEIPKFYLVGLDGKPPREVLQDFLPNFRSPRVAWHPDGARLSVWGYHLKEGWSFWTIPVDGGEPIKSDIDAAVQNQLKEADVIFTHFRWSPTGRAIFFEGVTRHVRNLWRVDVQMSTLRWVGGPERLTTGVGLDTDVTISQDGTRLAFTSRIEQTRIWSLPFDPASSRLKGSGQPVSPAGMSATFPDISANGEKLVFIAHRAGKEELWEKSFPDGRERLLLGGDDLLRGGVRWSRDGSSLTYNRYRIPGLDQPRVERCLATFSTKTDEELPLTSLGIANETPWDWSADGKWILAGSDRQTPGRMSLCLLPITAAPKAETEMKVITSHPEQNIYQARFSPDNRWISFIAARALEAGRSTIHALPAAGGEWSRITEGKYFDDKPRWSPDGRKLYFISNRTGFFNVWGIGFDPDTGRSIGDPFRITSFESPGQMILPDVRVMEVALAKDRLILPIMEVSGGIWVLDNIDR